MSWASSLIISFWVLNASCLFLPFSFRKYSAMWFHAQSDLCCYGVYIGCVSYVLQTNFDLGGFPSLHNTALSWSHLANIAVRGLLVFHHWAFPEG